MTPEAAPNTPNIPVADVLSAAARTIGQMPEEAVQSKFAELQQMRRARTEREITRQQKATDSLEGDEAAYRAGLMCEESDLKNAARWYRAAAVNDFPGASLKLAKVLTALAAEHHARGETQTEAALIEEASDWCVKACAAGEFVAGEIEALDLMEKLNARLDPDRPQTEPGSDGPSTGQCSIGGLKNAMRLNGAKLEEHLSSCTHCQAEQAEQSDRSASVPAPR
jgi:hypothetical protein